MQLILCLLFQLYYENHLYKGYDVEHLLQKHMHAYCRLPLSDKRALTFLLQQADLGPERLLSLRRDSMPVQDGRFT